MSASPQNYYEAKGYLWMKLMNQVKPGWTGYQQKAVAAAAKLAADPKKNVTKYAEQLLIDVFAYKDAAVKIYSEYIIALCTSWAMHALRNEGVAPETMQFIVDYLNKLTAPKEKKGKGKGAGKGKGKK